MKLLICALLCGMIFVLFLATIFADRSRDILGEWEDELLRLGRSGKEKHF